MKDKKKWLKKGMAMVEYALLLALIVVVTIGVLKIFGTELQELWKKVISDIFGKKQ